MRLSILPHVLSLFIVLSASANTIDFSSYANVSSNDALSLKLSLKKDVTTALREKKKDSSITQDQTASQLTNSETHNAVFDGQKQDESFSKKTTLTASTSNHAINRNSSVVIASKAGTNLFQKGFFYGLALTIVMLNFICYFLFEEKVFLLYAFALASVSIVLFNNDGLLALFGIESINKGHLIDGLLLIIAVGTSSLFAQKYLNISEFFPKLKRITSFLFITGSVLVFSAWLVQSEQIFSAANFILFSVLVIYFGAGVALFSKKNYAKFYVIAASIPLLFTIDFYVLKPAEIHFLFTESVHLKVALLVEMIILTYAIMFRMKAIKEENILRQTEMRIFLKRQESMMNRHNVERLMEDMYLENLIMHYDLDGLEIKLLQYISEGKENVKIARKLKMSEEDVEDLTKDLYIKLEISEQIQEDHRMVDSQPDYIYN